MVLEVILYIAFGVLTLIAAIMARQIRYAIGHFTYPSNSKPIATDALPSVTVCVPARNEQRTLAECLDAVLKSTYPKLEIIVLDDGSDDDTSTLIKSFASEGVRFVHGTPLTKGWLGKNHALQGLLNEASGAYVLYMGVDTRLAPKTLERLISYAEREKVSMVTVLPRREDGWRASVVFSPLRYFWEIVFHRRLWPATASGTLLIKRDVLRHRFQGFTTFKEAIQPETKMATELAATGEYRFLMSTPELGVAYEKKWRSQLDTSIRLLYPLLNQQIALAIVAALDLLLLLTPFVVLVSLLWMPFTFVHAIALLYAAIFPALYGVYTHRVWRKGWFVGVLLWPVIVAQEITLIIVSVIKYSRGRVQWKGRPIRLEAQN